MPKQKVIQRYINNYRKLLNPYLKKDLNLVAFIYPSDEGAIIEFIFSNKKAIDDTYKPKKEKLRDILKQLNQNFFDVNTLNNIKFSGTNTLLDNNRIMYIKDNDFAEWTESKAQEDITKLLTAQQ